MKIACFYSDSPWASWSLSRGLPKVIERMGHQVLPGPFPPSNKITKAQEEAIRTNIPTSEQLKECDLILVCGPEHLKEWLKHYYRDWKSIQVPKAGWYHEDMVRLAEEHRILYDQVAPLIDFHFMPNKIDAEKYGATWVPVGVDTEMFQRCPYPESFIGAADNLVDGKAFKDMNWSKTWQDLPRDIDSAFIGLMYDKRKKFHDEFLPYMKGIQFKAGNVLVQDFDGINIELSARLLADTYRRIKVLVNFPSLSNVLVSKVLEAAACGCYVVTASQGGVESPAAAFYPADAPNVAADLVHRALDHDEMRKERAQQCWENVHRNHRMELRLEKIFQCAGVAVG